MTAIQKLISKMNVLMEFSGLIMTSEMIPNKMVAMNCPKLDVSVNSVNEMRCSLG